MGLGYVQFVHPGRGLGRDGGFDGVDVAPAGLVKRSSAFPGAGGETPWILRSARLRWLNNPSGKHWTPYDLGLCKNEPAGKNRRESVDADFASQPDYTTGILARACVHATLRFFLLPRKRHNRFHPRHSRGRSYAQRSLKCEFVIREPSSPSQARARVALAKISLFCYITSMAWTVLALNRLVEEELRSCRLICGRD